MRICSLTLLSFLLLAAQALSAKVLNEAKNRQDSALVGDPPTPVGRFRRGTSKSTTSGKFSTKDQASCKWAVTTQEPVTKLKAECTQMDQEFSCVFAGNPTECLNHNNKKVYWKQIAQTLRKQKNLCRNFVVLKTRVCRKQFPESNLKLVNSTLIGSLKLKKKKGTKLSPGKHIKATSSPMSSKVKEDIPSSPEETQPLNNKVPDCLDNPDVKKNIDHAMEFCGEMWSSWCSFFFTMIQSTTC